MELRTASSPRDVKTYDTQRLREEFLIDDLFRADDIKLVYSHIDRIITGSAVPVKGTRALTAGEELRAQLVGLPLRVERVIKTAHAARDDALQPIASYSNMTCVSTMSMPSMYSRTVCSPCSTLESSME